MRTPEPSTESPLTLEQVREAIEMAWTDATRLPDDPAGDALCGYLSSAATCIDAMIERRDQMSDRRDQRRAQRKLKRQP
jgi:hypothetical protein